MTPQTLLLELRGRLSRGEAEGALLLLLEAWAEERALGLASAIAWLSPRTIHRHPPLLEPVRWVAVARAADPLSVAALVTAPWTHDRLTLLREKLLRLRAFPPDPRLASFALEIQEHLLWTGRHRAEEPELAQLLAWHGAGPAQPAEDEAWWAGVVEAAREASPPSTLEQQLLYAVFAAPSDDGPRHVYADYLLSAGDPYAALVSGSLRRESETGGLSAPQLAWWCRRLLGNVDPSWVGFWRGFPHTLSLPFGEAPMPTPGWATLETLELQGQPLSWLAFLEGRLLSGLRTLSLDPQQIAGSWVENALERLAVPNVRTLALPIDAGAVPKLLASRWPALETLRLRWYQGILWNELAFDEYLLGELSERPLTIDVRFEAVDTDWVAAMAWMTRGAVRSLRRVTASREGVSLAWERDAAGELRVLRLSGLEHGQLADLPELLRSVRRGWVDLVVVECLRPPGPKLQDGLRRLVARSHRAELRFEASGGPP